MFEALLGSKFSKKCKYYMKCVNIRVQLIRKKRQATVRFLKKDVADLLANGHELNAFGRMEALIVEINRTSCYDMIEQYCQCILNQLPSIEKQRECPEEAMEAMSTIIFAAARFSDLPELWNLRQVFTKRFGGYMELSVNAEFVEKVQKKSFPADKKLQLMHDIAEEFTVRWDSRAFRQKLSNPCAPPCEQPKRSISNIEGLSHAKMDRRNAAGFANEEVEVHGRMEAVISPRAAGSGRGGAGVSAGGLVNRRKEPVIDSAAAASGRDGTVLNAGGSFNGRKEAVPNYDITANGRKETINNSAMSFSRRNDAVLGGGEGREVASKVGWEPPSWTFVQKRLVQPEPRDIRVIPVVGNGRSTTDPAKKNQKVTAASKETENVVEPVFDDAGACLYVEPKERPNGNQKDDWFKPKVIHNGIHQHDGLADNTSHSRLPIAQEGPGLIGREKQSVASAIPRNVKAVNMIPLSSRLKESGNDAVEGVAVYNESSRAEKVLDPSVQERRPTVPARSKDARPFNMIPPPYTKPKIRDPSTPADDTKVTDGLIKRSSIVEHERPDDNEWPMPVSGRRRLPTKPTLVPEIDSATKDARPNGRQVDDENNLDRNQMKAAAEEMNGAIFDERYADGRREHGGRISTAMFDGDCDEEEGAMDRLLVYYSKRGMNNDPRSRRAKPRSPSTEVVVHAGSVRDYPDDCPHRQGNGRIHPTTKEPACYRPERVALLPRAEPTARVVEAGVSKGPARATALQPDLLSPGGARLHPRLPDCAARLIALKNA